MRRLTLSIDPRRMISNRGNTVICPHSSSVFLAESTVPAVRPTVPDRLFYHLRPLVGSGRLFTPVDSNAYMRPVMSRDEAEAFIAGIPAIEPAICSDNRFNHVDSFYRDLFKTHELEDLVSVIKGLTLRLDEKKTRSSRAEATIKRAKDILYSELSISLDIDLKSVESYIAEKSGPIV